MIKLPYLEICKTCNRLEFAGDKMADHLRTHKIKDDEEFPNYKKVHIID